MLWSPRTPQASSQRPVCLRAFSTPPRHPLNTESSSENPNTLCFIKKVSVRTIFHDLLKWKFLSLVFGRGTRHGAKVMNLEVHSQCWCVWSELLAKGMRVSFGNFPHENWSGFTWVWQLYEINLSMFLKTELVMTKLITLLIISWTFNLSTWFWNCNIVKITR